jgi:hypothetical protein
VPGAQLSGQFDGFCPMCRWCGGVAQVVAYDIAPPTAAHDAASGFNEYHAAVPCWTEVERGGAAAAKRHGASHALMLCYPPPASTMAEECLRHFKGSTVIYVGEWSGDTATPAFESALQRSHVLERRVPLPGWGSTAATLTIWRRRGRGREQLGHGHGHGHGGAAEKMALPEPCSHQRQLLYGAQCCACGAKAARRCRFCRAVAYCSAVREAGAVWSTCGRLHAV